MKLGLVSDLHLEFRSIEEFNHLLDLCVNAECDQLVIAGDTHSGQMVREMFFSEVTIGRKNIEPIIIMGNHDFYRQTNIFNDFFDRDGIVGGCLWTNFGEDAALEEISQISINDFRFIKKLNREINVREVVTPQVIKNIFYNQRDRIFESDSSIVTTHFVPVLNAIDPKFAGNSLNRYFVNDLGVQIKNSNKKLWMFGHSHSIWDFTVDGCRFVANPLGYPNELYSDVRDYKVKIIEV